MDAYLAAFAVAGTYQLVTTDKAFKQFKGLDLNLLSTG
jgi:predicted nucleic acid-binding protein